MLRLYNTLTHKVEKFTPLRRGLVTYYTCGPSVYLQPHVGNFKTYVFEDVLRRWLEYKGLRVKHAMNITDVEDKGVRQAKGSRKKLLQQTRRNSKIFFHDAGRLKLLKPTVVCKATEHVPDMIKVIGKLMRRGYAYKWKEDGNIYYDISKFRKYGKLSRTPVKKFAKVGRRVSKDDYWQFEMGDFALWKARRPPDGDIFWRSPWGEGRPGWNIECSAMSMKYLGSTIDIHAGGSDLVFSHHENEVAQSEGATGKRFVNYWLHCRHLLINGKKMSKSLRNFYTISQLVAKGYSPRAIRYMLLSGHYRDRLNFTFKRLGKCEREVRELVKCHEMLKKYEKGKRSGKVAGIAGKAVIEFENAMDDDLNAPKALTAFFNLMCRAGELARKRKMDREETGAVLKAAAQMDSVLALL